jgi:hypothetical protein
MSAPDLRYVSQELTVQSRFAGESDCAGLDDGVPIWDGIRADPMRVWPQEGPQGVVPSFPNLHPAGACPSRSSETRPDHHEVGAPSRRRISPCQRPAAPGRQLISDGSARGRPMCFRWLLRTRVDNTAHSRLIHKPTLQVAGSSGRHGRGEVRGSWGLTGRAPFGGEPERPVPRLGTWRQFAGASACAWRSG